MLMQISPARWSENENKNLKVAKVCHNAKGDDED
jgi:hypothetical protein